MTTDTSIDHTLMARALELARCAEWQTRPNPAVGAVIAREGRIIGEGFHRRAGEPHAEIEGLQAATEPVAGATMYVTLEPCNHTGRTGPCTEAVIAARIARVVIAARDPNVLALGGVERLLDAGIAVEHGLLAEESRLLNAPFFTVHQLGRPLITAKYAMTADGASSALSGDSKWITGEAARAEVHRQRARHDAVLAGIGTVLRDDARLSARGVDLPPGPALLRVVLDSNLRLSPDCAFLRETQGRAVIVCAEDAPKGQEVGLKLAGAEVWRLKRGPHGVSLPDLVFHLRDAGVQSVYLEGGRTLTGRMLEHGLVDRVAAFVAPRILGGGGLLGPVQLSKPRERVADAWNVLRPRWRAIGDDMMLEGWLSDHLFAEAQIG